MKMLRNLAVVLVFVGALNWGLVGLFGFNLVNAILGSMTALENLVYILVGLSGVWLLVQQKGNLKI